MICDAGGGTVVRRLLSLYHEVHIPVAHVPVVLPRIWLGTRL